jgi:hypothetical protein
MLILFQRILREHGSILDVAKTAQGMCELAARSVTQSKSVVAVKDNALTCMILFSGNLDMIKILVSNGASCSIGNEDNRTVSNKIYSLHL